MAKRACFLLALFVPVLFGQNAELGGLVTDPSGLPVPGASIDVRNPNTGIGLQTTTNSDGFYSVPSLKPGTYAATVQAKGFKTLTRDGIVLEVTQRARLDLTLEVGQVEETVTVNSDIAAVNTADATVSTVVDDNFVQNLPMNGRSFQTLIQLTPGVVTTPVPVGGNMGQFSVNGQRVDSNYMTVDGVSANFGVSTYYYAGNSTGGAVPATNVSGGFNALVSVDAMQEFRIQTSTYAPEYGRQPGAQIQIASRSGTNDLHGTAFDYFRNTVLNANDWFADADNLGKAAMRQNDFGAVLGGAIVKNKTFFFLSYESQPLAIPRNAITYVPSLYARSLSSPGLAPFMNMWPLPNRGQLGSDPYTSIFAASYSDTFAFNAGSARIDQAINDHMTLFGRFNYSPSNTTYRRGDLRGALNNVKTNTQNITTGTIGFNWLMSPTATNEIRVNYSRDFGAGNSIIDTFGGGTVPTSSYLVPYGNYNLSNGGAFYVCVSLGCAQEVGGTYYEVGRAITNISQQYNVVDNQSIVKGAHTLKFGVDFRHNGVHSYPKAYLTEPWFNDFGPESGGALSGQVILRDVLQARDATLYSANLGLYVQDVWKIGRRLTATYGLRWDLELPFWLSDGLHFPVPTTLTPPQNFAVAQTNGAPFHTNYASFGPRVGLAYELSQRPGHELVLRGGYGIFYDLLDQNTGNMLWAYGGYPIGSVQYYPPLSGPSSGVVPGTFPFTPAEYTPPSLTFDPQSCCFEVYDPHIKQPRTYEWNFSLQQSFGHNQSFTLSYVGAAGRQLASLAQVVRPAATFGFTNVLTSYGKSNYNALEVQFQRRMNHGFQTLISYSWSHSLDTGSTVGGSVDGGYDYDSLYNLGTKTAYYGPSNFDIRQTLSAAVRYEVPRYQGKALLASLVNHWAMDNIFQARTGAPLDVGVSSIAFGGFQGFQRPNVVAGQPLYLTGAACAAQDGGNPCPGGEGLNEAAFTFAPSGTQGDLGRNALRAFGAWQWDTALRREFPIQERLRLQFRAETFNLLNHPNFGPPQSILNSAAYTPGWGLAQQMLNQALGGGSGAVNPLYQLGGPRSLQLALKVIF